MKNKEFFKAPGNVLLVLLHSTYLTVNEPKVSRFSVLQFGFVPQQNQSTLLKATLHVIIGLPLCRPRYPFIYFCLLGWFCFLFYVA
jgi:hypothetical protein